MCVPWADVILMCGRAAEGAVTRCHQMGTGRLAAPEAALLWENRLLRLFVGTEALALQYVQSQGWTAGLGSVEAEGTRVHVAWTWQVTSDAKPIR